MGGRISQKVHASVGAGLARAWVPALFSSLALMALALPPLAGAQVTREGILRATISENFARHESKTTYSLRSGGKATPLLPTAPVSASTGDRVEATGTMHEGRLVGQITQVQDLTPEADLVEPRKVAVLLIRFPGDAAEPWSLEQARGEVFTGERSADAFLAEESWGRISLAGKASEEGDVFGWFTVNAPSGCANETWNAEARAAAESKGISLAGYDHIIYMSTFQLSCTWLGRASLGGGTVNINGTFGGSQVIAHELGHNLVLRHAGSWTCSRGGASVPVSDSCVTSEYGDPFDVMGNLGMRHSSAWNLRILGLVGLADGSIETVNSDGTYTLQSALNPTPEPHVLRIARADSPPGAPLWWYYLEIRQRGGLFEDFDDATMAGVSIRVIAEGSATETRLIDNNPATSSFFDAPLQVGRTFSDGNVHITVLSAGGGTASVSVGFGTYEDEEEPSPPTKLSASQVGDDVKLQWNASADNVGLSHYVVFRDGSEIGTSPTTSFTDAGPSIGTHAYTVYAEDEAGNLSEGSTPKVVTVADVEAPSAPTGLSGSLDAARVKLQWDASTDNVGVSDYAVFRDGAEIGTSPSTAFTDESAPAGQNAYVVYAEDVAGNRSPGSEPRVVTVPDLTPPPSPPPDNSSPSPDETDTKPLPRVRPVLRWRRLPNGAFVLIVKARRNPGVVRVGLWLNGRLLRSRRGRVLRVRWQPRRTRCARVYRLRARTFERTATGQVIATTRVRRIRLPSRAGKVCRHRASAPELSSTPPSRSCAPRAPRSCKSRPISRVGHAGLRRA
jgi:chitodextrinase